MFKLRHKSLRYSYIWIWAGIGFLIGASTGVAALGGAVNGGLVFAAVGAVFGLFFSSIVEMSERKDLNDGEPESPQKSHGVTDKLIDLARFSENIVLKIWNFEVSILTSLGVLKFFILQPVLFFVLRMLVIVTFFPVGVVLLVSGIVAMCNGASAEDGYVCKVA